MEKELNQASQTLIDQLPDHIGEQVTSLSQSFKLPLWQFVCGIMLDSHQVGRLSSFQLDPAWKDGYGKRSYECAYCGKTFKPKRINQLYCSNECGTKEEESKNGTFDKPKPTEPAPSEFNPTEPSSVSVDSFDGEEDVLGLLDSIAAHGETTPGGVATDATRG